MDKIVCIGKNYHDHVLELGDTPVTQPVLFLKPPSALRQCQHWGDQLKVPLGDNEVHYECEIVLQLRHGGYKMSLDEARNAIGAYTLGLDMTLRKEQSLLKSKGHPWTISKVFPNAAIIGPWIESDSNMEFLNSTFQFTLDNNLKQKASGNDMMYKPAELIMYASSFFQLCAGDVIFTGTPAGVGQVVKNSIGVLEISGHKYSVEWD